MLHPECSDARPNEISPPAEAVEIDPDNILNEYTSGLDDVQAANLLADQQRLAIIKEKDKKQIIYAFRVILYACGEQTLAKELLYLTTDVAKEHMASR